MIWADRNLEHKNIKLWTEKIPELSSNIVDVTSSIVIPFLGSEITKVYEKNKNSMAFLN